MLCIRRMLSTFNLWKRRRISGGHSFINFLDLSALNDINGDDFKAFSVFIVLKCNSFSDIGFAYLFVRIESILKTAEQVIVFYFSLKQLVAEDFLLIHHYLFSLNTIQLPKSRSATLKGYSASFCFLRKLLSHHHSVSVINRTLFGNFLCICLLMLFNNVCKPVLNSFQVLINGDFVQRNVFFLQLFYQRQEICVDGVKLVMLLKNDLCELLPISLLNQL